MLKFNGKSKAIVLVLLSDLLIILLEHESDLATSVTTAPIENPVLSGTLILKLISANNLVTPIPSATSMLPPNPQSLPDGLKRRESMMRKEHL